MCLFLDISCRVSDIIPAEWHRQGSRVSSTSSIIGQPRVRLSSVESTLLSIVLVAISTQHEDDKASQRRLTTVCKSQPSTSQTDCVEICIQLPQSSLLNISTSPACEAVTRPSRPALHGLTNKHIHTLAHTTSLLFPLNGSLLY